MLGMLGGCRSGSEIQADGRCARCIEIYRHTSKFVSEVAPVLHCQLGIVSGLLGSQVPRGSAFMTVTVNFQSPGNSL